MGPFKIISKVIEVLYRLNLPLKIKIHLVYYINYTQNNWAVLLLVIQFIYNATPQEGLGTLLFKTNYSYKLKILLML